MMRAGAGTRGPRFRLLRAAATVALMAAAVPPLPAQETGAGSGTTGSEAAAVLVSGPARGEGLPFLPPNMIEYQRGVYELTGAPASAAADAASTPAAEDPGSAPAAGDVSVEVFYTEAPVFRRGTWTEAACDGRTVHALPEAGGTVVHYSWPEDQRHVFFRFVAVVEGNGTPPGGVGAAGNA
ncbi:MAG: hypothetical protein GVY14_04855, partial [Spirochaetes bacterium]|nr:hypothetical protein [Spirochaetota bacterium]